MKELFTRRDIRKMVPQATAALQTIMISLATNSVSERSFLKLKLLKNHLRASCGDIRLSHPSHPMACSTHKDILMNIPLNLPANIFVADVPNRISAFGQFA